jgi:hypothetical protein
VIFAWLACAVVLLAFYCFLVAVAYATWKKCDRDVQRENLFAAIVVNVLCITAAIVVTVTFPVPWPFA